MGELPHLVVVGRRGSGKTEFSEYVSDKYGYEILRFSETITTIAQERGWGYESHDKRTLQDWGLQLKKEHGMGFLAVRTAERIGPGKRYVFDGAREPDEVGTIKDKVGNVLLLYIDSSPNTRFQRINRRDSLDLEEFEKAEEHPIEANIGKLKDAADYVITNNFSSLDEFHQAIDSFFQSLN